MNEPETMIEVVDLHKRFKDLHVLKGVSTTVKQSEVVAIMGPSGGGKSTFLLCLNRLEEPSSGHIYIEGVDILAPYIDINRVRTESGMVFQSGGWFIEKHYLRLHRKCAGYGHTLLLTTGQLFRIRVSLIDQAHLLKQCHAAFSGLLL